LDSLFIAGIFVLSIKENSHMKTVTPELQALRNAEMRLEIQKAYALNGMQAACQIADHYSLTYELCSCCAVETPIVADECVFCGQHVKLAAI
jgi:hypothetical protein